MATVTSFTVNSGWTQTTFLANLRSALIEAGWMTDWHDTYSSGSNQAGVMRIRYGAGGTYRDAFYVFTVTTSVLSCYMGSGWDSVNNVFTGTQYLDFHTAAPVFGNGAVLNASISSGTAYTFNVYKSTVDTDFALIQCTQFAGQQLDQVIGLITPGMTLPGWVDLDKVMVNGLFIIKALAASFCPALRIVSPQRNRRSALCGGAVRTLTGEGEYGITNQILLSYAAHSAGNGQVWQNFPDGYLYVPSFDATANPAFSADASYIINGVPFHPLTNDLMPSDFGLWAPFGSQAYAEGDIIQVTAGVNEWRVVVVFNGNNADRTSLALLARVV